MTNEFKLVLESRNDAWFERCHSETFEKNPDFVRWWIEFYGDIDLYAPEDEERQEYWKRCAFALMGWTARGNLASS